MRYGPTIATVAPIFGNKAKRSYWGGGPLARRGLLAWGEQPGFGLWQRRSGCCQSPDMLSLPEP